VKIRAGAAVAVAALLALGVAACAPISSQKPYDPSDGVNTTLGQVKVLNALILTTDGKTGNMLFSGYNGSDELVQLNVQYSVGGQKESATASLLPDTTSDFGYGKSGQFFLPTLGTQAGSLLPVYFQWGSTPGRQLLVPVLDGSLPQYASLLPTDTPTPTPTPTSTNPAVLPPPVTPTPTPTAK
jgi:hypothetical protein